MIKKNLKIKSTLLFVFSAPDHVVKWEYKNELSNAKMLMGKNFPTQAATFSNDPQKAECATMAPVLKIDCGKLAPGPR